MDSRVRDPIHNFVVLREPLVKLLDTRVLQRLRGIRQLALASLVYPGAVHTRFDHTLGVTHVAGLMGKALGLDEDQILLVQQAALLHDIGHGPFSHVSEHALERYADRDTIPADQKKEKIHELITARMIRTDPEIIAELGANRCDQIIKLLGPGYQQPALRSIVSGPLDADKQDYLLRDSHFCGVQAGLFDIHQLHRSLVLVGEQDEEALMIAPDGVHAVEQFVLAKYYLTTTVYRHRVRLITDQMIVRAIVLGIEKDNLDELRELYRFDNSDSFVKRYTDWDDGRFMKEFSSDSTRGGRMLKRLRERKLLKQVFRAKVSDFRAEIREMLLQFGKREHDALRFGLEAALAEHLWKLVEEVLQSDQDIDPDFVILHAFDVKSVRDLSKNEEAGILVDMSPAPPSQFNEESALFRSISESYLAQFVEVYAPVEWESITQKKQLRRACQGPMKELIETHCLRAVSENKP